MRAFVVCTGRSLNDTPLEPLREEFTIGINHFDMLGLDWDPTWWVVTDFQKHDQWDIPDLLRRKSMFIFREQDRDYIESFLPLGLGNTIFIPRCEHIGGEYVPRQWHLPMPCDYGGGASVALQLAAVLSKGPIYLIGADLYKYRGPDDPDLNHFHPDYCPYKVRKSTGEEINSPEAWDRLNDRLVWAHEIARDSAAAMGIDILNATIGGSLEVYPRVPYESLFVFRKPYG